METNRDEGRPIPDPPSVSLAEVQSLIETIYGRKDADRGTEGTFMWFAEEVGELSAALREGDRRELASEFADVLAWLATLANMSGVDLPRAFLAKYGGGCPGCGEMVCRCGEQVKP